MTNHKVPGGGISPSPFQMQSLPAQRLTGKPYTYYAVRDRRNCCVAIVGQVDAIHDDGEAEANARLFRAAPELLAALIECERVLNANFATPNTIEGRRAMKAMNQARTAITGVK